MPGYIILDTETRKTIAVTAAIAVSVFILGILIGYFSGHSTSGGSVGNHVPSVNQLCGGEYLTSPNVTQYARRYVERHSTKHTCLRKRSDCLDFDLPRNYIAYHLQGKTINFDGKLNDPAWLEVTSSTFELRCAVYPAPYLDTKVKVRWDDTHIYIGAYIQGDHLNKNFVDIRSAVYPAPYLDTKVKVRWDDTHIYIGAYIQGDHLNVPWTENFVDIRSAVYPAPFLDTKVKVRWDDTHIYIGAYIQETNLWATKTAQDDRIHYDNNFEVFMDVDGSMFNYKQIQINVLGTMMDQMLYLSPHDAADRRNVSLKTWHGEARKAVYAQGTVNDPSNTDTYWSVEMAFTFKSLAASSNRPQWKPFDNEVWFMQFGRAEHKLNVVNGNYSEPRPKVVDWWSWQPCDAINLQLQDRWGLVQFKRDLIDETFSFPRWHLYKALFETMAAMRNYKAVNSKLTSNVDELDLPPYLLSGVCVEVPEIRLTNGPELYQVIVRSKIISTKPARICDNRYVQFSDSVSC